LDDFNRKILPVVVRLIGLGVPIANSNVLLAAAAGPTPLVEFVLSHPSITPEILNPPNSPNAIHKVLKVWAREPYKHADMERNIELLLAHGADVNHLDNHATPPIATAARFHPGSMLNLLLSNGILSRNFNFNLLLTHLNLGANINQVIRPSHAASFTPLWEMLTTSMYASLKDREHRLRFWYEHGADILWLNERGEGIADCLAAWGSRFGTKDDLMPLLQELIEDAKRKGGSVRLM